ncbi:MAG: putative secreted hydrolase [Actinomycetia bacterium]|nr:putative secreted hydrolase [Actinomycetes bacterium]
MLGGRKQWLVGVLVAVLALGATPAGARAAGEPANVSIMVLGDSYSAGNGGGAYVGSPACRRSTNNYGAQYARLLSSQQTTITTVACSGAVSRDITSPAGARPAQVSALNRDYDVVLLTIGGNDAGFSTIVASCLLAAVSDARRCDAALARAERFLTDGTLETRLTKVLTAIRARTSAATRIVLLGYPYLEGDAGYVVPSTEAGVPAVAAGRRVRALTDAADRLGQKVIDAQGSATNVFISTKRAFAGHELTARRLNPARWFVAPFTADGPLSDWYHPTRAGYAAEAQLLLADPRVPKADVG